MLSNLQARVNNSGSDERDSPTLTGDIFDSPAEDSEDDVKPTKRKAARPARRAAAARLKKTYDVGGECDDSGHKDREGSRLERGARGLIPGTVADLPGNEPLESGVPRGRAATYRGRLRFWSHQ